MADRFGVLACFDDEKRSDTYAEQVQRCPGCGCWLNAKVLLGACEEARSGIVAPQATADELPRSRLLRTPVNNA